MNYLVIRGYEVILIAFIVGGLATTVYNIVTFRQQSNRIARRRTRRIG